MNDVVITVIRRLQISDEIPAVEAIYVCLWLTVIKDIADMFFSA